MLLDHVGGLANHLRRGEHEWTVSNELALELAPEAARRTQRGPHRQSSAHRIPAGELPAEARLWWRMPIQCNVIARRHCASDGPPAWPTLGLSGPMGGWR
jgi:hypothetical protein